MFSFKPCKHYIGTSLRLTGLLFIHFLQSDILFSL